MHSIQRQRQKVWTTKKNQQQRSITEYLTPSILLACWFGDVISHHSQPKVMYGKQPPPQTEYLIPTGNKLMSENMGSGATIIKGIGPEVEPINLPGRRFSNPTGSLMVVLKVVKIAIQLVKSYVFMSWYRL